MVRLQQEGLPAVPPFFISDSQALALAKLANGRNWLTRTGQFLSDAIMFQPAENRRNKKPLRLKTREAFFTHRFVVATSAET
jgi:hypothetical protein